MPTCPRGLIDKQSFLYINLALPLTTLTTDTASYKFNTLAYYTKMLFTVASWLTVWLRQPIAAERSGAQRSHNIMPSIVMNFFLKKIRRIISISYMPNFERLVNMRKVPNNDARFHRLPT